MNLDEIDKIMHVASDAILKAKDLVALDELRAQYIGKKGFLTLMIKDIHELSAEERPKFGQNLNCAKEKIQILLHEQAEKIKSAQVTESLVAETVDVSLPARGQELGSLHPITKMRQKIEKLFVSLGFTIAEGPEIEDEYHNFSALNFPEHHPARYMQDTFYFPGGSLLRTHTSPIQIREMEKAIKSGKLPPFRILASGRVYRCDSDATHSPMFHQVEGFVVAEDVSLAHLKWMARILVGHLLGDEVPFRFRPSYFPFVEPGAEVDILWHRKDGKSKWLEIGGCGMVHPNVLKAVDVDSEKYSGFAFGLGIDRLAMLHYGIDDLRLFFENDVKFLEQF